MPYRKQEALNVLEAIPRPNLRAAWDGEMPDGTVVFIGWQVESSADHYGRRRWAIRYAGHPGLSNPGGRVRERHLRGIRNGERAFLLNAFRKADGSVRYIEDDFFRVELDESDPGVTYAVETARLRLSAWRMEQQVDQNDPVIQATTKEQTFSARRGQGLFRSRVIAMENRCRLTGIDDEVHLRASHIKPWSDSSDRERLDGSNGLLLAPHVDHLFDQGWITFSDSGDLMVTRQLDQRVLEAWGLQQKKNVGNFSPEQRVYLAYHRTEIFKR